jgi:iron complex transport system ATP-binding protein
MTITTRSLSVTLGKTRVVDGATLTLQRGRVTAVLGPNGAGKTSLIRALAGLIPFDGTISLDTVPLATLSPNERARRIGYLPQNGTPAWNVTVRELVSLGRLPYRSTLSAPTAGDDVAIDAALAATDTANLASRTVGTLSGGERARVTMARVLAGKADWIIADEPLANLDPPHQRDLLRLLRAAAEAGDGVIVVLHQLNAAMRVADDIVLMKRGAIIANGAKADVMTSACLRQAFDMGFTMVPGGAGEVVVADHT